MDACLLSESSLFIQSDRILMITCGQTDPILAVPDIIGLVGKKNIHGIVYERKNIMPFHKPSDDIRTVVEGVDSCFSGKICRVGPAAGDHVHLFYANCTKEPTIRQTTVQLLMSGIDPSVRDLFSMEKGGTALQAAILGKLNRLYEDMTVDTFFFDPFGYSLNGIRENSYYTIHVSPQPEGSYASFESNADPEKSHRTMETVVSTFKPLRFSVLVTGGGTGSAGVLADSTDLGINGYRFIGKGAIKFDDGYTAVFMSYRKMEK